MIQELCATLLGLLCVATLVFCLWRLQWVVEIFFSLALWGCALALVLVLASCFGHAIIEGLRR